MAGSTLNLIAAFRRLTSHQHNVGVSLKKISQLHHSKVHVSTGLLSQRFKYQTNFSSCAHYPPVTARQLNTSTASKLYCAAIPHSLSNRSTSTSANNQLDQTKISTTKRNILINNEYPLSSPECNIPVTIADKLHRPTKLHNQPNHPLQIIKTHIESQFPSFSKFDTLDPVVSTLDNFDSLLILPDHVSRSKSDTYYVNEDTVLRTHTSAHQKSLLCTDTNAFLCSGDVYRRDEIDSCHYPVFHQMEGVKIFKKFDLLANVETEALEEKEKEDLVVQMVEQDLKRQLEGMVKTLFGDVEMRWVSAYFPFTNPSYELEIYYNDTWLEVLGCGVMQPQILSTSGRDTADEIAWAFGLGLERLAMVLFQIPDIRLFWSDDARFHSQFRGGKIVTFVPYSKYPPCFKDVSFWLPSNNDSSGCGESSDNSSSFHVNDLNELVRNVAGDLVEQVQLIDEFCHPKTKRTSHCYRVTYRSMDRSLTNDEIDALQKIVRDLLVSDLGVDLR